MSISVLSARARLGAATRFHPDTAHDARRDLAAAKIEQYVERALADAPPLTDDQLDRVGTLLRLGGRGERA